MGHQQCNKRVRGGPVSLAWLTCLAALAWLGTAAPARAAVPAPSETKADVVVSGRTSTAQNVRIVGVGDEIPKTFSGGSLHNTPGFSWWVSEHYALKTDYKEDVAKGYLTLLELAYPHYVELFGGAIPDIQQKRMAVVYASSAERLKEALASDGIQWNFGGGGITYEGRNCAYQYPSGTLLWHQRYILLHECTHLYQMCLTGAVFTTPSWYYEGVADSIGSHVYDSAKKQLTVFVLDKATVVNYLDDGLAFLKANPGVTFQTVHDKGGPRGVNVLMVHFLSDDPCRLQRFRIWRDEMRRKPLSGAEVAAESARLLTELFGPWDKLNADFARWAAARRNTFHYVLWGWEQEGNALWAYGFGTPLSQTNVNLPPAEKLASDSFRMDYPAEPAPPILGPVRRGVAEPVMGAVVDFSPHPQRGLAGIGLGVLPDTPAQAQNFLKVLIRAGSELVIDGAALGMAVQTAPVPGDVAAAVAAGGNRYGLTVTIGQKELKVTVRGRGPADEEPVGFSLSAPLKAEQRERLMTKPLAILAHDGYHRVTPFFDDRRAPDPDLGVAAPPNRWRNPGDRALFGLYKASWLLKDRQPASLVKLRGALADAADKDPATQAKAVNAYENGIGTVVRDIRSCGAQPEAVRAAVAALVPGSPGS